MSQACSDELPPLDKRLRALVLACFGVLGGIVAPWLLEPDAQAWQASFTVSVAVAAMSWIAREFFLFAAWTETLRLPL